MMVVVCVAAIVHGGGSLDVCSGAKNATFCAIYIQNRTFYQDRLGTNIGKVEKRVAFFAGRHAQIPADDNFLRQEAQADAVRALERSPQAPRLTDRGGICKFLLLKTESTAVTSRALQYCVTRKVFLSLSTPARSGSLS